MSQWCDTCSLGKITGRYQSCGHDCPAFGKSFEELAEIALKQQAEIRELQKRIVFWREDMNYNPEREQIKAIKELVKRLNNKCYFDGNINKFDIDNIAEEMISQIKE